MVGEHHWLPRSFSQIMRHESCKQKMYLTGITLHQWTCYMNGQHALSSFHLTPKWLDICGGTIYFHFSLLLLFCRLFPMNQNHRGALHFAMNGWMCLDRRNVRLIHMWTIPSKFGIYKRKLQNSINQFFFLNFLICKYFLTWFFAELWGVRNKIPKSRQTPCFLWVYFEETTTYDWSCKYHLRFLVRLLGTIICSSVSEVVRCPGQDHHQVLRLYLSMPLTGWC